MYKLLSETRDCNISIQLTTRYGVCGDGPALHGWPLDNSVWWGASLLVWNKVIKVDIQQCVCVCLDTEHGLSTVR